MRKTLLLSMAAAVSLSAAASSPVSIHNIQGAWQGATKATAKVKLPDMTPYLPTGTRSIDNPQTDFTATAAEFYYYGDILGNGTGVYYLFLANMPMDKGMPTATGQMARIEFVGTPTDLANPVLPTGTFNVIDELTEAPDAGIVVGEDSDILDCFPHPDDPSSLVAYTFVPTDGTLTITKTGDEYTISFAGSNSVLLDTETEEILERQGYAVHYTGTCEYVDINGYTPFDGDINLPKLNASGRYSDGNFGNYSIAFYTDGMLDEEGFIVGAGYLLNTELFVDNVSPMNLDALAQTFTPTDILSGPITNGHFGQGLWYDIFGGYYVAIGTALTEYDQYGEATKNALAMDGTITGTRDGDIFTIVFDLVSAQGHKVTGTYTGKIGDDISDFSSNSIGETGFDNVRISGGNGCITAPEDAKVFNINGMATGKQDLPAGVYVVRCGNSVKKVIVK